jgi:hypothetical protein
LPFIRPFISGGVGLNTVAAVACLNFVAYRWAGTAALRDAVWYPMKGVRHRRGMEAVAWGELDAM